MRSAPVLLAFTLLAAGFAVAPALGAVPCPDPRGCPNLTTDAEAMTPFPSVGRFTATHCAVVEGMVAPGTRALLRFNFVTPNHGPGDLVIGDPSERPDLYTWSPCHQHYHFNEYADYRLWTLADWETWHAYRLANPGETAAEALDATGLSPVEGRKQGFCVADILPRSTNLVMKYDCTAQQGLSVGWADAYFATLDGQWIDVTDVPPGVYVLEAEVNAERVFLETSYADNRGWTPVVI